jgi:hypothetical protein
MNRKYPQQRRPFLLDYFYGRGEKLKVVVPCNLKWSADTQPDDRIQKLGVGTVMGLPGDTNLELLHYIGSTDMHWGEHQIFIERDAESLMKLRSRELK